MCFIGSLFNPRPHTTTFTINHRGLLFFNQSLIAITWWRKERQRRLMKRGDGCVKSGGAQHKKNKTHGWIVCPAAQTQQRADVAKVLGKGGRVVFFFLSWGAKREDFARWLKQNRAQKGNRGPWYVGIEVSGGGYESFGWCFKMWEKKGDDERRAGAFFSRQPRVHIKGGGGGIPEAPISLSLSLSHCGEDGKALASAHAKSVRGDNVVEKDGCKRDEGKTQSVIPLLSSLSLSLKTNQSASTPPQRCHQTPLPPTTARTRGRRRRRRLRRARACKRLCHHPPAAATGRPHPGPAAGRARAA